MINIKVLFYHYGTENVGIEYLSAFLKAHGQKTELLFDPGLQNNFYFKNNLLNFLNFEKRLIKKAKKYGPDLIAFSSVTNAYPYVKSIAKKLKSELDVPTIVGGIHATCLPKYVLKEKCFDMVCRGEGEYALLELCNNLEEGGENNKVKNIWLKKNKKIMRNPFRPLIKKLDTLPFPDKDLFYKNGVFKSRLIMLTGRGCPHACSFCINNHRKKLYPNENYLRRHSVDYIIDALRLYYKKYKYNKIRFEDDIFLLNDKWLEEFCKRYKKEIDLPFHCFTNSMSVNKKVIKLLKFAGCELISLGVQSGSQDIRNKILNRKDSNRNIIRASDIIRKNKIKLITELIFGIPNETKKDMIATIKLNKKLKPQSTATFLLYPFPNTDIFNYSIKKGFLPKDKVELIKEGGGSYHNTTLLNHPYGEYAYKSAFLIPLFIKLPELFEPFFWILTETRFSKLHQIIYLLSIPCMEPIEFIERVKELPRMVYYAQKQDD